MRSVNTAARFSPCVGVTSSHIAFAPDAAAYPCRGEIRAGKDKRGHVADARVGHHPDVLEAVRLFDEADRLFDPPPRETALDDAPLRLERAVDGKRGQEHHWIPSEAFDDDEVQLLFRVHREPHRHRAERCRHVALLPVRIERDVVRMTHRALTGKVVDFVHSAPRQDAAPFQPHDEVAAFPYEIVVECGSVAPSVVYGYALASCRGILSLDDFQHLVVLSLEAGGAGRPELQRKRHGLASARAAGCDHAAVVSVHEDVPPLLRRTARVPDAGDELHLVRELLADLRRVDEKEGVARGQYSVDALLYELLRRFREMGKHFAHEMGELGFRFRRDFGIIHGAATSLLSCKSVFYRKTAGGCRAFFARQSNLAKKWVNSGRHFTF